MPVNTFSVVLEESYMISSKVKHFIFNCTLTPQFSYLPGQFITIHFEHQGKSLKRSYSIANSPQQDNRIEFAAGFFEGGPGTELLFNLKPGDSININGPFGRLVLKDEQPDRTILVATSTGVTPYRAMLNELSTRLEHHPNLQIVILQGVQKREDILYRNDFEAFAQKYPQVIFKPCLSQESPENIKGNEFKGYVHHLFPELNLNPLHDLIYLCGNPGMIDDAYRYLQDQGFATQHIIREKYISR